MAKNLLVKLSLIVALILCSFLSASNSILKQGYLSKEMTIFAQKELSENYKVYDEDHNLLFEREGVEIGDNYLSKDFKFYEVISLDNNTHAGIAKFIKQMQAPNVSKSDLPTPIKVERRVIAMYMTHNDESYVNGDGYDSVYGVGGIHDIAKKIKQEFENKGIKVSLDETLHIPHDTSAYSRSKVTALNLLKENPDAVFDIHRDGASRSAYLTRVNGEERSMVRIVVGKGNVNSAVNQEFATYVMAVANELYPWLIKDIYIGRGHYNQNLYGKALLFEMGSHMIEKSLVMKSVEPLCEVVSTALFETTVNENENELTINGSESSEDVLMTKKESLNKKHIPNSTLTIILMLIGIVTFIGTSFLINYYIDKKIMEED